MYAADFLNASRDNVGVENPTFLAALHCRPRTSGYWPLYELQQGLNGSRRPRKRTSMLRRPVGFGCSGEGSGVGGNVSGMYWFAYVG